MPDGGWLDGAYGVMAALGVLRAWAESGEHAAPRPDAGRLGRRGGGPVRPQPVRQLRLLRQPRPRRRSTGLTDAEGDAIADVLAENGVELARVGEASAGQAELGAYLELHIEQGPVLESEGLAAAAVTGTAGVERLRFVFSGQASHAGTTPMEMRRDAGLAAAQAALAIARDPGRRGWRRDHRRARACGPGIVTAVAGEAVLSCDLRHPEAEPLARMLAAARAAAEAARRRARLQLAERPVWRIEPIAFDPDLVGRGTGRRRRDHGRPTGRSRAARCTTRPRSRGCCRPP